MILVSDNQKIHVIGNEDIVLMFSLLGIEGTVIKNNDNFLEIFNLLKNKSEIGMVIIAMNLSTEIIDFLIDFKLDNRKPLIYLLPDVFQENFEKNDVFLNKIYDSIGDIIL